MNFQQWTELLNEWDAKRASTEAALNDVLTEIGLMLRGDSPGPPRGMVVALMVARVQEDEVRTDLDTILFKFATNDLPAAARELQRLSFENLPSHMDALSQRNNSRH